MLHGRKIWISCVLKMACHLHGLPSWIKIKADYKSGFRKFMKGDMKSNPKEEEIRYSNLSGWNYWEQLKREGMIGGCLSELGFVGCMDREDNPS